MTIIEFDNLDEDDLRKILNVNIENPEDYLNLSIFKFSESQLERLIEKIAKNKNV